MLKMMRLMNLPAMRGVVIGVGAFCLTAAAMLGHGALHGAGPLA